MSVYLISEAEAKRSLSLIFHRVNTEGVSYEIKRGKVSVASIIPAERKKPGLTVGELKGFFEHLPKLDDGDALNFESGIHQIRSQIS
ncbi:MAG TPA: hypothetical protein VFU82_05835 [Gammaproteobacteria bacterium]|nr:hypothetical protein [Gammaproteobacteria bacterium]